jgi:hypothetical protein
MLRELGALTKSGKILGVMSFYSGDPDVITRSSQSVWLRNTRCRGSANGVCEIAIRGYETVDNAHPKSHFFNDLREMLLYFTSIIDLYLL